MFPASYDVGRPVEMSTLSASLRGASAVTRSTRGSGSAVGAGSPPVLEVPAAGPGAPGSVTLSPVSSATATTTSSSAATPSPTQTSGVRRRCRAPGAPGAPGAGAGTGTGATGPTGSTGSSAYNGKRGGGGAWWTGGGSWPGPGAASRGAPQLVQ